MSERGIDWRGGAAVAVAAVIWPGVLLGALLAWEVWSRRRTPSKVRVWVAGVLAVVALADGAWIPVWIADDWFGVLVSQVLAGPLVLFGAHRISRGALLSGSASAGGVEGSAYGAGLAADAARRRLHPFAEEPAEDQPTREMVSVDVRGLGREEEPMREPDTKPVRDENPVVGPPSVVRLPAVLRLGRSGGRLVALELPGGLARHGSVLGDSGTGKTTTLVRIIHDALQAGYAVFCADAKGQGTLRDATEELAGRFGVEYRVLDPMEPGTIRYNPARGIPAEVSNKLLGAFRFGPSAEIFKQVAQEVIPTLVAALREAGEPVTMQTLATYLDPKSLKGLARSGGANAQELSEMVGRGKVTEESIVGMRARLGALRRGSYGPVFDVEAEDEGLDVYEALRSGVTYVSMPAMASSEDTELMARVLMQDLKQAAAERLREKRVSGAEPRPALVVMDEFSSFREAEQMEDLLGQAREAGVAAVLSALRLPQNPDLRKAMLSAGLLISHATNDTDAGEVARAIGNRKMLEVSRSQRSEEDGEGSESISTRKAEKFEVEPDRIKKFKVGEAAVRIRYGNVRKVAVVNVEPIKEASV